MEAISHDDLSLSAQTAFAQVLESIESAQRQPIRGSFAQKRVDGRVYWYFQFTGLTGKLHQVYVGPDTETVRALVERQRAGKPSRPMAPLARAALVLGCASVLPRHFRTVQRLAEYGFFGAGGILVGTHAFVAIGNLLGVRWRGASQTQDVDFAHAGKDLAIALPASIEVDVHSAIESLGQGLLPIQTLEGLPGPTYLNPKEPDFRLDFLTVRTRSGMTPFVHPQLKVTLQPLPFMDFLLRHSTQGALLADEGAVLVNLPSPARYALHKLIVYAERKGPSLAKAEKDIAQAGALLSVLWERRAWELDEAWADLIARGKGWRLRVARGLDALDRRMPGLLVKERLVVPVNAKG
jgi:hypothetical protein